MKQLLWQTKTSFLDLRQNSTTACLKYPLDTESASVNIIHLLCYVAGVRTVAFVTVYAQISFLCISCFRFSLYQKTFQKLRVLIKGRTSRSTGFRGVVGRERVGTAFSHLLHILF